MLKLALIPIMLFSVMCAALDKRSNIVSDPEVISTVDLDRYSGTWYEIARFPTFFQRDCIRSKAEYGVIDGSTISVRNECTKLDGSSSIEGVAKITDPSVPAKLKVRFNFFAQGDYWIVALDPNYQWVVVSGPQKKSLFILARIAPMAPELLERIMSELKQRGFNLDEIVFDNYE